MLKSGTVVDLEPAGVEVADLRIEGNRIVERGLGLEIRPGDEAIDLHGKIVFPGLVSAHHRLYATLLRGAPRVGSGYAAEEEALRRLEAAMDGDEFEAAASAGGLEGLSAGTTTVFDVSAAPAHIEGSLTRVAQGLRATGLRSVLAHEVTERNGASGREAALVECVAYAAQARGRFRGAFAMSDLAALSDESLEALRQAREGANALVLATLAEDPREEGMSKERFGLTATQRLLKLGLTGSKVVLAQGVHLSWPERSELMAEGTWLVHVARWNMASQAGFATPARFGVRACLGTGVMSLDCFAEAQAATLRTTDSGQPIDVLRFLANGHRLASEAFGFTVGPLQPGAAADVLVLDYQPPTSFDATTLAAHVLFGFSARCVESVMIDGLWRQWKRKPLGLDPVEVTVRARQAARATWSKMLRDRGAGEGRTIV